MKVFEVETEFENEKGLIEKMVQYVISEDDELATVAKHFHTECEQLNQELISVRYVVTVGQRIAADNGRLTTDFLEE